MNKSRIGKWRCKSEEVLSCEKFGGRGKKHKHAHTHTLDGFFPWKTKSSSCRYKHRPNEGFAGIPGRISTTTYSFLSFFSILVALRSRLCMGLMYRKFGQSLLPPKQAMASLFFSNQNSSQDCLIGELRARYKKIHKEPCLAIQGRRASSVAQLAATRQEVGTW